MAISSSDNLTAKILSIGAALTTVLVVSGNVTDPVNVPKLLCLSIFAFAGFAILLSTGIRQIIREYPWQLTAIGFFVLFMLVSVSTSNSPLSQNLYGSYGRNNGFIAYLALSFIIKR